MPATAPKFWYFYPLQLFVLIHKPLSPADEFVFIGLVGRSCHFPGWPFAHESRWLENISCIFPGIRFGGWWTLVLTFGFSIGWKKKDMLIKEVISCELIFPFWCRILVESQNGRFVIQKCSSECWSQLLRRESRDWAGESREIFCELFLADLSHSWSRSET